MKKFNFSIIFISVFLISLISFGQQGQQRPQMTPEKQLEQMKTELSLTAEQLPKVEPIIKTLFARTDSLRNSTSDRQARSDGRKKLREQANAQLKLVLTEEQYKLYQKKEEERRNQMRNNKGGQR